MERNAGHDGGVAPVRRARRVFWIPVALCLPAAPFGASWLYEARIRGEFNALHLSLQKPHGGLLGSVRHYRFGELTGSLEPSLLEDAAEWIRFTAGLSSRLDYEGGPGSHAYHLAAFEVDGGKVFHVFLWSPRQLRFIHFMNWEYYKPCSLPGCPWKCDPVHPDWGYRGL